MRSKLVLGSMFLGSVSISFLVFAPTLWAADNISPLNAKEGLWEVTVTHSMSGMPAPPNIPPDALAKLPPDQRARIEGMMKGTPTTDERLMRRRTLVAALGFFWVVSSAGQMNVDNSVGLIREVLRKANASGSIVYSDKCASVGSHIPVPPRVRQARKAGSTVEVLEDMFSDHSEMQVSRDSEGMIRMVEQGVPTDILDIKIHRLVFDPSQTPTPELFHGPNMALADILSTPEVRLFEEKHNIVQSGFRLEGNMG